MAASHGQSRPLGAEAPGQQCLYYNGMFYQGENEEQYEWVVVDQGTGQIVQLGKPGTDLPSTPIERIDLEGQLVLPGLQDSHLHIRMLGETLSRPSFRDCRSVADMLEVVRVAHEALPPDAWIVGQHWDHEQIREGRPVTMTELEAVCPGRFCLLYRGCFHVAVASRQTLELMGVPLTRSPAQLTALKLEQDTVEYDATGQATGLLREAAATRAFSLHEDVVTDEQRRAWIQTGLQHALELGLTVVQPNDAHAWPIYRQLHQEGQLNLRVHLTLPYTELRDQADAADAPAAALPPFAPWSSTDDMLRCQRIKLFADGSLGAGTAALSLPYRCAHNHDDHAHDEQHKEDRGILNYTQDDFNAYVARAHQAGFQLEIHVIGDAAADSALTALEAAGVGPADRAILTHCQVLSNSILPRMHKLQTIANIQPSFVVTDAAWLHKRLDERLLEVCYAWRTLLQRGIPCAGGSDAPVETINPLQGMHDAIFRDKPAGSTEMCFLPQERLSFDEALHLYTRGGAYAGRSEQRRGIFAEGFDADFVVLPTPVHKHPELLASTKVSRVVVAGQTRFLRQPDDPS
ncbi:uncharacterized protein MONBRDRAFT_27363 [Monosiga brevicollis MX1]|uniref:Amidohydrolase 3 domain-containing protein n=1 Tax=Monosiga brevicollis TaxID=81824 RepID=A9V527_MONBE|nr:uncharacterized protein MONBRDRAFT_27363 [Monosiga brevicollis MX1]EDQ87201.1 predicted protein [Monosiga brevicollis MX1]|eukprot:XP_001747814.1 hypothetical protein [Monosiga brevicollis MX1]